MDTYTSNAQKFQKGVRKVISDLYPGARVGIEYTYPSGRNHADFPKGVIVEYNEELKNTHSFSQAVVRKALKNHFEKIAHPTLKTVAFKSYAVTVKPNFALAGRILDALDETDVEDATVIEVLNALVSAMPNSSSATLQEVVDTLHRK